MKTVITGAKILLEDDLIEAELVVEDGKIASIGLSERADEKIDASGLILAPALIDVHGDAFERQMMPRPNVFFPMDAALLDTDRQLACNGIATTYHSLTLSWEPGLRSVDRGVEFVDGLEALEDRLTIDNRIQLRWETYAFEAFDLIERVIKSNKKPSVAFNDHLSMAMRPLEMPVQERLFEHNPNFPVADTSDPAFLKRVAGTAKRSGLTEQQYVDMMNEMWQRRDEVQNVIKRVSELSKAHNIPMLSHDDTQVETRDYYREMGADIAEFPMSFEVARHARDEGDFIIFGSPNVVRGGSHIGSPSAADMFEDGLCDILASDYFYPAMLAAVGRLAREKRGDLWDIWSLVSKGPATASKLDDRGIIEPGKRADLVLIDWPEGETPAIKMTISGGKIAYRAGL